MDADMTNMDINISHEKEQIGNVIIHNSVVAGIAATAVNEVEGVQLKGPNSCRITTEDDLVKVQLVLNILFGHNIPQATSAVQDRVCNIIESMTGFGVSEVNIRIDDILYNQEKEQ